MPEDDRSNQTVEGIKGTYSSLNFLGAGGMKVAYNATDDQQGNEVVVLFPTAYMPNGVLQAPSYHQKVIKAMQNELKLLKNMLARKPPHSIPRYIDESKNDHPYFGVMEKAGVTDISKKCKLNPLSQSEIIKVATDVLHGLHFLHTDQPSIIHRDIKPGNITIKNDGSAVLIDFGGVKHGWDTVPKHESNKTGFATPGWTCPHQDPNIYGANVIASSECDLYALGRVMFYMATGINISSGQYGHKTIHGKLTKKLHEIPNCHVTKEFSELVDEMCDPAHRGLTANSVLSRLRTLSSSKAVIQKPKRIQGSYHAQPGGSGNAQLNVHPPARIILEGIQHTISDYDDGMGNITHANVLIGRSHDISACQQKHPNGDGCNISDTGPDYQGKNAHVDDKSSPPFISRHHMRVYRYGGQMYVISSIDGKWNAARGKYEERGRSAIFRAGRWIPMTNKKKEVLNNGDVVSLLWNKDRGSYMSFTFYTQ